MNRTIKNGEADKKTIRGIVFLLNCKAPHYQDHQKLRAHRGDDMDAYNCARRLKALNGLTSYECICKIWISEPERFILDPTKQMPGLKT